MFWTSTLQIRKDRYSDDLEVIILFVGILSINLGDVSLFAYSPFTFLATLIVLIEVSSIHGIIFYK